MEKTSISKLSNFNTSKKGIEVFVDKVISEMESGLINPLDLLIYIKSIEKSLEGIKERAKDAMNNEADKYSEKSFEYKGAKIEKSELGVKYIYSDCGDIVLNKLMEESNILSDKIKTRESFLKSLKEQVTLLDEETGEIIKINPPVKKSTTGFKVTIK